jgi:hypothetical protein
MKLARQTTQPDNRSMKTNPRSISAIAAAGLALTAIILDSSNL